MQQDKIEKFAADIELNSSVNEIDKQLMQKFLTENYVDSDESDESFILNTRYLYTDVINNFKQK